ncbi:MAG: hypothetical protein AAF572_12300 [Cyanobacteria bacterium P01_B01_bin.77]
MTLTSYDLENRFDQRLVKPINADEEQTQSARDTFAPGLHICPHCTGNMLFDKGGSRDKDVAHILLDASYQARLTSDRLPEVRSVLYNLSLCSDGKLHPDIGLGFVARGKLSRGHRAAHYAHGPGRSNNCGKHAFHDSIARIVGSQIKRETLQVQPTAHIEITPDKRMDPSRRKPDLQVVIELPEQPVTTSAVEIQLSGLSLQTLKERTSELAEVADKVVWLFKHREVGTAFYAHAEWLLRNGHQCRWIKVSKDEPVTILPIEPYELIQRHNKPKPHIEVEQEDRCDRYGKQAENQHSKRLVSNEGLDIRTPVKGRVGLFDPLPVLPPTPREVREVERQQKAARLQAEREAREARRKEREAKRQAEREAADAARKQQEDAARLRIEQKKAQVEELLRETLERFPEHLAVAIKSADTIDLRERLVRVRLRQITDHFDLAQIDFPAITWLVHMSESLSIRTVADIAKSLHQSHDLPANETIKAIDAVLNQRPITVQPISGLPLSGEAEKQILEFIRNTLSPTKPEIITTPEARPQVARIQYRDTYNSSNDFQSCLRQLAEVKDTKSLYSVRYNYRQIVDAAIETLQHVDAEQYQRIQGLLQASPIEVLKLMGQMRPDPRDRIEKWLTRLEISFNPGLSDRDLIYSLKPDLLVVLHRNLEDVHQEKLAARKSRKS